MVTAWRELFELVVAMLTEEAETVEPTAPMLMEPDVPPCMAVVELVLVEPIIIAFAPAPVPI